MKIGQKKGTQGLPGLSNFLQRNVASSRQVLRLSVSPPSALSFPRQWQQARESWWTHQLAGVFPTCFRDPCSVLRTIPGDVTAPTGSQGQGWPLPLESPGERSSRVSHGESTILPLLGGLPSPCTLMQSVRR